MSRRSVILWAALLGVTAVVGFALAPVGLGFGGLATGNGVPAADPAPACSVPTQYSTITAALSAGCGSIAVGPGTYDEQLTITAPVSIDGSGLSTILQPSAVDTNAPSVGQTGEDAVIAVLDTHGVTLSNMVVDGSLAAANGEIGGQHACGGPTFTGILFADASGSVSNTFVENFYQSSPSLYGCETNFGLGIDVESSGATPSTVTILNNVVNNYQKNGISCDGSSSNCIILGNLVRALSGTTYPGLGGTNGIQVAFGASATVANNMVKDNQCGSNFLTAICGGGFSDPNGVNLENDAAGILLYSVGFGTTVVNNQVASNDIGIEVYGPSPFGGVTISQDLLSSNLFAGITIEDGHFRIQNTVICPTTCTSSSWSTGYVGVGVFALTSQGDSSSSVVLDHVTFLPTPPPNSAPTFTYSTGTLTAVVSIH